MNENRRADACTQEDCLMSIIDPMTAGNERPVTRTRFDGQCDVYHVTGADAASGATTTKPMIIAMIQEDFFSIARELWMKACTVFHNWVITATYFLPDYLGESRKRGSSSPT